MKKTILSITLASILGMSLIGCSGGSKTDKENTKKDIVDADKKAQDFNTKIPTTDIVTGDTNTSDNNITEVVKSLTVQDRYLGKYMPYLDGSRSDKLIKVFKFPNDFENDDMSFVEILYVSNDGVENITSDGFGELNATNLKVNYMLSASEVAADYITFTITQGEDGEYLSIEDKTWDNSMIFDSIADIYSHIDEVRAKLITIGG